MSITNELPDESWSEEEIVELLNRNISGSTTKETRLLCLDELRKRNTIKQINDVMELLLEIANIHGRSRPESSMIVELMSRLVNLEELAFNKFHDSMQACSAESNNLLYCSVRIIRNLEKAKKKKCMSRLLSLLMDSSSFTDITDEMYQTLVTTDDENINKEIIEATLPYLRVSDALKVVYAVKITSKLSSKFLSEIEPVVERALKGWYNGNQLGILKNITDYFGRIKDQRSIDSILQIMKSDFNSDNKFADSSASALASVIDSHPKEIDKIWEFLEKEKEHYPSILMAFAKMRTSINLQKLFSIVEIDLSKWRPREALRNIMIKAGNKAKPLLFKIVKDKDQVRSEFALQCLEEIGVSVEEYSKVFEKPPILQVYEFFYEQKKGMFLDNLWKEQDKLRHALKKKYMTFEYFIQNLFSALGFVTLYVDPSGKEGVDLVAFAPNKPYILIIGCTTSILKNDLEKMKMTLSEMEDTLKELLFKYRILPTVFISRKVEVSSTDSEYAGKNKIAIVTQKETTTLLNMLRTRRGSNEIIKHIEKLIPPFSIKPYT